MTYRLITSALLCIALSDAGAAQTGAGDLDALGASARGDVRVHRGAHGDKARFVTSARGGDLLPGAADKSRAFLRHHGGVFGIADADRDLALLDSRVDHLGHRIETFAQYHDGVPVFGARLKAAVDERGALRSVHGAVVDGVDVDTVPAINATQAASRAIVQLRRSLAPRALGALTSGAPALYVYNAGFARGATGRSVLAWEVEVRGNNVREFVYVDAHSGKFVDRITGIYDALDRRIYEGGFGGSFLVWFEGQAAPTGTAAWDNLIDYSEDTYNLFSSLTGGGYLSWDGVDGTMHAVNNDPAINCPNAQFTGSYIRFCNGTTTDDVVGHEWVHGYTQETHGLIYQYQSGAMNEAYSDIFGEVVDFLNGDGNDAPNDPRTAGECSIFGGSSPPSLTVSAPASVAGSYLAGGASFNPALSSASGAATGVTPADGCSAIATDLSDRIALIDRGSCPFTDKVLNAQSRGAIGVVIINNQGDGVINMGGSAPGIAIGSVMVGQSQGAALKAASGVTATITFGGASDASYRWLTGEDSSAFGGAIRDMWNPLCFGDPGKVSDPQYACDPDLLDSGGVHSNSGIINHGFALLVDGGAYNGQTIAPIGLTKAAHLYWRAMSVYQTPVSGYSDHAVALAASCQDLMGINLNELSTQQPLTGPSGEVIDAGDCAQVDAMIEAVELNLQPTQCGFETLLAQDPPALCGAGETAVSALFDDFEGGLGDWITGSRAVASPATYDVPAWTVTGDLPFGVPGQAAFGADPVIGNCSTDIEAGVQYLQSPPFTLPADARLVFDHSLSTERDYDGGNVKVSVNGGAWSILPASAFLYNGYNGALVSSDNPLGGEAAWHGTDGGTFLSAWGRSHIDLGAVATAGDEVRLRFEMGTDGCNGVTGWYLDNVQAYRCELAADSDGDGVADSADNCTLAANTDQRDSNSDGYGNACDADLNNDGVTNVTDLGLLRLAFFSADADADFNGDGIVNTIDLGLMRARFFLPPGPSGIAP